MENISFIDEILQQAEIADQERKFDCDRVRADQILMALQRLDNQSAEIERTAESEIRLIASWKEDEISRVEKKRAFLTFQLENYIKGTDEKTIRLAHGVVKLRMGREKIEVVDIKRFLEVGKKCGLLRTYPEYQEPDLRAIADYVKRTGEIPTGVEVTPATTKFSYQLIGGNNGKATEA